MAAAWVAAGVAGAGEVDPPLCELGDGRAVACHLHADAVILNQDVRLSVSLPGPDLDRPAIHFRHQSVPDGIFDNRLQRQDWDEPGFVFRQVENHLEPAAETSLFQ